MTNDRTSFGFPCTAESVPEARRAVRHTVLRWGIPEETVDTAELLVSELVTNVVLHAHGSRTYRIVCQLRQELLTVTVIDHGRGVPKRRNSPDDATSGRGLFLVEQLADDWGTRGVLRGKATFFVLKVPERTLAAGELATRRFPGGRQLRYDPGVTDADLPHGLRHVPSGLRPGG
ncbi:ATP-binding protein [Streptacidiphilus sp. EB103A]|uniref:ATP-binding protein n=1 Tax=Streptacidiphilus sp. EB103A TaxID=3156275 RepID=UPI003513D215